MAGERTLPGLGLTGFWTPGSDGWDAAMDANLRTLSAVAQIAALSRTTALPGSPNDGDIYIVPSGDEANRIALRDDGEWVYLTPKVGFVAWVDDDEALALWTGTAWITVLSIDKATGHVAFGGASADANNAMIVRGTALLFDAATDDLRFTFNKAGVGDDCAVTFQTGYSARALFGLLGDDDLTFKVSPDGSNFYTGLAIDKNDGTTRLPANPRFNAYTNFENYIAADTWTKVQFNNEEADPQSTFDTGSNRFVAPVAGTYLFGFALLFKQNGTNDPTAFRAQFYKNGAAAGRGEAAVKNPETGVDTLNATAMLTLAAGDYIEVFARFDTLDGYVDDLDSSFWGHLVP